MEAGEDVGWAQPFWTSGVLERQGGMWKGLVTAVLEGGGTSRGRAGCGLVWRFVSDDAEDRWRLMQRRKWVSAPIGGNGAVQVEEYFLRLA